METKDTAKTAQAMAKWGYQQSGEPCKMSDNRDLARLGEVIAEDLSSHYALEEVHLVLHRRTPDAADGIGQGREAFIELRGNLGAYRPEGWPMGNFILRANHSAEFKAYVKEQVRKAVFGYAEAVCAEFEKF